MAQGKSAARVMASLRLAKLRLLAGLATGEELSVVAAIDADPNLTDQAINHEISILERVSEQRTAKVTAAPTGAPRRPKQRTAPSLASAQPGLAATAGAAAIDDSDLFLSDFDLSGL
jgi:hypothetical protein